MIPGVLAVPLSLAARARGGDHHVRRDGCFSMARWDDDAPGGWINPERIPLLP